ncbi:MAG: M20/M25/M40 family metallo-hydrolase, partial [Desulfobacteraceae bacterium]|nr:M20/M25/M40 family metallo-hydrolase [Desulfobacteraceae bacterium]
MINHKRLRNKFEELVQIYSGSKHENQIAENLALTLKEMGAEVTFDNAGKACGSDSGNLIAKFKGNVDVEPIFLCGHMDTVEPGENVKPVFDDGIFKSDGTTILGADDKSALAIILEILNVIFENKLQHPPIEIIFTICEEIGLLGAKNFDLSLIDSKFGYILDSTDTNGIATKAPAANKLSIKVFGKAAHSGGEPENGVNALAIASKAISKLNLGRIDHETTCNLGTIRGGIATNIIPDLIEINGEVRSHDEKKLETVTNTINNAFLKAREEFCNEMSIPEIEFVVENDFPKTNIPEDSLVVTLAQKASENLGRKLETKVIGGGADANIFFGKGIMPGVIGTGMKDVHTVNESISLNDMVKAAELVLEIIKIHVS